MMRAGLVIAVLFLSACFVEEGSEELVLGGSKKHQDDSQEGPASPTSGTTPPAGNGSRPDGGTTQPRPSTDGGTTTTTDGGGTTTTPPPPPPPPTDAFTGAAAFTQGQALDQSTNHHGGNSRAGQNCLGCHNGGTAARFVFAGTAYVTAGTPAVGAEVRVASNGTAVGSAYTDSSGNFWLKGAGNIPTGSLTGVRNATLKRTMNGTLNSGACSNCHGQGTPVITLQ